MANTHETIADIIAEKRQYADDLERACNEIAAEAPSLVEKMEDYKHTTIADIRREADRLEAALKRELSKNMSKNGADFGQLGDCAKLREALETALKTIRGVINSTISPRSNTVFDCRDKLSAALSAPPRNCDRFETAEEAWDDYDEWVESYRAKGEIPPFNEFGWLFAPATEEEGGAK